jgi:hypothetical protein
MRPLEMPIYLHLHLYLRNLYFTDPLFELSQNEYEIGQYNTIQ